MGEFFRRLRYLLNRRSYDQDLQNDMEFHCEMAARAGRSNFGNTLRLREQSREAWGWMGLERLVQDLRYGARILARSPGFTIMALLVLAIGIGVNVAAFDFFNMMALTPLPVRDPSSLVRLQRRSPSINTDAMSYPTLRFYEEHAKTLSAVMAVMGVPPMQIDGDVQPTSATFVSPNYFTELGTSAGQGRLFDPARDASPNAPPAAVISYGLWQRRFGGDPSVIGHTIHINRKSATIVGVTPWNFASLGGFDPDLWMPIAQQPYFVANSHVLTDRSDASVKMWARLAPGVTAKRAEQELLALTNQLRSQYPKEIWENEFIHSDPGGHLAILQPDVLQAIAMVAVLTLLILAVACANLGGLLLARAVSREHEITIRVAIGASRGRIFRQLCTESFLLAILGALAGLALGAAVLRITVAVTDAPKWMSSVPDWRVLLFTLGVTLLAVIIFGLAPALQIARQRQRKTLARKILLGAQVAASCVLLIVAGLLVRAAHHALYSDPGFGYQQLLSVDPQLAQHGYTPATAQAWLDQMQDRLRTTPGVRSVSLVKLPPMGHTVARIRGQFADRAIDIYPNSVAPGFFQTMGIPLLLGRAFYPREQNAVIVSQSFARRQWPGQNPIGQQLGDNKDTVVGVAGNARINALNDDDAAEEYWPAQTSDMPAMVVMIRTAGEPGTLPSTIKSVSASLDPGLFPEIHSLNVLYRDKVSPVEKIATVVSLIGMVAVLLAAVGIIGLVAFAVSQRTKEIAIRIALGAKRAQILVAVLRQFSWPVAVGLIAGIGFAASASKILRKALYGVSNFDPLSYAAAITLLIVIIGVAALLPARRLLHLDLGRILHYQ